MRVLFNIERLINPSPAEKEGLHKILHIRTLKKNEFFLKEGEVCTTLAFIENGSIRYFYQLEEKQVCKDFIFENGLVCSFASLFSHDPSWICIEAMEDTQIVEMNYNDVLQLYENFPIWQKLGRIIVQENIIRAERREAALLKELPEDRFHALIQEHPKIFKRVPLQYIASYLGITRETLSRYRSKAVK